MARTNRTWTSKIGILQFARAYLGLRLYPWQRKILLAIEAGYPVAALVCNNGGEKAVVISSPRPWFVFNFSGGGGYGLFRTCVEVEEQTLPPRENIYHP